MLEPLPPLSFEANLLTNVDRLDRSHPQPLYEQLKDVILEMIERTPLRAHEQIPSERELSERFNVNRLTVRKAIEALVQEGTLFRQHGKGTFVSPPKISQPLLVVRSFTDAMLQEGRVPGTDVHRVRLQNAGASIAQQLRIDLGAPIFELVRVRSVDRVPLALITSYIPYDLTPNLLPEDFHALSLYALLRERCGIQLAKSSVTLEPTLATHQEAEWLSIQPGQPLMLLRGLVSIPSGRTIEYSKALYRGDKVRFTVESGD